jgi:hypothetical protein
MKKIGEYTMRGQLSENETETAPYGYKVPLFDGRFDTGYRVVEFTIWGSNWASSTGPDVIGKLGTQPNLSPDPGDFMNANDQREIAWAGAPGGTDTGGSGFSVVDPDNMIIEDLYVYTRGATDAADVNYMIKMVKYDITDWKGALSMVRNKSQG